MDNIQVNSECTYGPSSPFYLNDIVCQKIPGKSFLFGRVGQPLHYTKWSDVREGFYTNFKIHWNTEQGEVEKLYPDFAPAQVHIVDREIKLGSKVTHNGLLGEVVETHKVACIQTLEDDDTVIWEVNADNLFPLERAFPGRHISYKSWIGLIVEVKRELFLKSKDNQFCSIPIDLTGKSSDYFWDSSFSLPGDKFKLNFLNAYKANWLSGGLTWLSKLGSSVFGPINTTVLGTKIFCIQVKWMGICRQNCDASLCPMPPSIIKDPDFEEFQYVDISPTEYIQKGFYRRYKISEADTMITIKQWKNRMLEAKEYNSNRRSEVRDEISKTGNIVKVLFVRNVVTIQWQDDKVIKSYAGSIQKFEYPDKENRSLAYPTFVINKIISNEDDEGYGVVKSYNTEFETYLVDWYAVSMDNYCTYYDEREVAKFDTEPHPIFQKLTQKGQIVIKSPESQLTFFEVGVVSGVYNGQILVYDYDGEEFSCYPTDLVPFNYITTWNDNTQTWLTEKKYDYLLSRKVSGNVLNRIDSAADLLCGTRRFIKLDTPISTGRLSFLENSPETHHFYNDGFVSTDYHRFVKTVQKEINILKDNLPDGIWVKGYEDRMDLFSVLIEGPFGTPYEFHIFLFDVKLPSDYPENPPLFHFISWSESINPNLYTDGKICLSLLGTWEGNAEEKWNEKSTLLQVLISIQGLILVKEPYFNEPSFEKLHGTDEGLTKSSQYNAKVLVNCMDSCFEMLSRPSDPWKSHIAKHYYDGISKIKFRLYPLVETFFDSIAQPEDYPDYPLFPLTRQYALAIRERVTRFDNLMSLVDTEGNVQLVQCEYNTDHTIDINISDLDRTQPPIILPLQ